MGGEVIERDMVDELQRVAANMVGVAADHRTCRASHCDREVAEEAVGTLDLVSGLRLLDMRGEVDLHAVLAAVDAVVASWLDGAHRPGNVTPDGAIPAPDDVLRVEARSTAGCRRDPVGYVLLFADHVGGRLILEHSLACGTPYVQD
jgi:hypothetical protein